VQSGVRKIFIQDEGLVRINAAQHEGLRYVWRLPATDDTPKLGASHHLEVAPYHEVGHAVAYALGGFQVRYVKYSLFPFQTRRGAAWGICQLSGPPTREAPELLADVGLKGLARHLVATLAGPAAELRISERGVAEALKFDMHPASELCFWLHQEGLADRSDLRDWAWVEACRLVADPTVWAVIVELAERWKRSKACSPTMRGSTVAAAVSRKFPQGWEWSEPPLLRDTEGQIEPA
jgi:hypothetical protein